MAESKTVKAHKPFISPGTIIPELTPLPLLMGVLLGILFGASSLYLALKVGMTVSASIPVAVLSITLFRGIAKVFGLRKTTILENNIVQTTGSAGESIAFGVAVTMPALLILGYEMELTRIMLVAVLGGLLGVLMMIPLRHALTVAGHDELPFPEGTACAEVLMAGEKGGTSASTVFGGFFLAFFYKFFNAGMRLWTETVEYAMSFFKGAMISSDVAPELLGVGYIIGPRIACIMVGGGILSSWVIIPMIKLFGDGLTAPLFPATVLISQMGPMDIWKNYVLYIGAGAVAAGGIISLFHSLPTIIHGAKTGLKGLKTTGGKVKKVLRTDDDLPLNVVIFGSLILVLAIWVSKPLHMNLIGSVLIVAFGFLFVTVSSRLTGEIGSSSNPISGMTVATLLITSLAFLALGWVSPMYKVTALSVAAIVCVAASNGGTTAQDLKTGYLVGATPRFQQIALLIGVFTSAIVIGFTLKVLNDASTVYSTKVPAGVVVPNVALLAETEKVRDPAHENDHAIYRVLRIQEPSSAGPLAKLGIGKYLVDEGGTVRYIVDPGINGTLSQRDNGTAVQKYQAPKARLMSLIIDGILSRQLPWGLVLLGVSIALVLELCGIASLPFAVGVYLPLAASAPIFFGGVIRYLVGRFSDRKGKKATAEEEESGPGILFSSGLIAGGSIAGICVALLAVVGELIPSLSDLPRQLDIGTRHPWLQENMIVPTILFAALMVILFKVATSDAKPTAASKR